MLYRYFFLLLIVSLSFIDLSSAAHFIVGVVNDSIDGTIADGHSVMLWKQSIGTSDNLTDIIGPSGNSGVNNIYMVDCELLNSPCVVGDTLQVMIIDTGDGHNSNIVSIIVTGAGFDAAGGLYLNSPPLFYNITLDDDITNPLSEIDLTPGSTKNVKCIGILRDYENNSIGVNASIFDNSISSYISSDDNNNHYSNYTCFVNSTYGVNMTYVECGFNLWYYSNSGTWNCTMLAKDNLNATRYGSNLTNINRLLAISLPASIDYGVVGSLSVSNESTINISNYGNTLLNISLEGYAITIGDNLSMNCTQGSNKNISIYYEKYNLTYSNTSALTLAQFEQKYSNLTSSTSVKRFNLNFRQNDVINDAINASYWRMYVPPGVAGSCAGNIIFGARTSPGS